jgi:hypothetical protein
MEREPSENGSELETQTNGRQSAKIVYRGYGDREERFKNSLLVPEVLREIEESRPLLQVGVF